VFEKEMGILEFICYYCEKKGERRVLDKEEMKAQRSPIMPPGSWALACRNHLLEHQQDFRKPKTREA